MAWASKAASGVGSLIIIIIIIDDVTQGIMQDKILGGHNYIGVLPQKKKRKK